MDDYFEGLEGGEIIIDDDDFDFVNGLQCPPLDEGALDFITSTATTNSNSMKLSGFFDEFDDYGNLRNKIINHPRPPPNRSRGKQLNTMLKAFDITGVEAATINAQIACDRQMLQRQEEKEERINTNATTMAPPEMMPVKKKIKITLKIKKQPDVPTGGEGQLAVVAPVAVPPSSSRTAVATSEVKFEATKDKIRDTYQKIANDKKRKRIQVIDRVPPTTCKSKAIESHKARLIQKMKNIKARNHAKRFRPVVY